MTIDCRRINESHDFEVIIQYQGASHAFEKVPAAELKKIGFALAGLFPQNNLQRSTILQWLNGIQ